MTKSGGKPVCPECGKTATGNFCQHCGSKLGGRFCNQCGSALTGGAKFCNQCGNKAPGGGGGGASQHKAAAAAAVGGQNLAWWIAGFAMFGLITVVGVQMVRPAPPDPVQGAPAGAASGATGTVDLNSMTPIQAADRLFDRIMRAVSRGDSVEAQQFMPMALDAYVIAEPLTNDGLFHLSLLQRTGSLFTEAAATAQRILDQDPDHLLGLSAAAEAAIELGDNEAAAAHYQHIVDVYDAQMESPLPEYLDHSGITDALKDNAEAFLAGR